jgi:lipoate-protein ligase A
MLAHALQGLGVPASLAPAVRTLTLDAGGCFSQPAGGEIMVEGRKVVGSAQLRQGTALLQHGSILLEDNQDFVAVLTRKPLPGNLSAVGSVPQRSLEGREVAGAVTCAASARWGGSWEPISSEESVLSSASHHYDHFRSSTWTWAR